MDDVIKNKFGYCKYGFEDNYVHIYDLFIYPEFRQQGQARKILKEVIDAIRKLYNGTIQIVANPKEIFVDKCKLKQFYKSMGFEVFDYYG